jgi:hypothetical protein
MEQTLGPGRGLRAMYGLVQQQAAAMSYLDLFRLFAILILLVAPLVLLMKRGGGAISKDAMTGH